MWMRVGAVDARMWTWETVTDFDGVLGRETLRKRFREDFPESSVRGFPVMRELYSFNSSSGRRHRYLVAFPQSDLAQLRKRFDRVVPGCVFLYGVADALMRSEGEGNLRFGALVGNRLYILVFFEGRLCHWSEEPGHDAESAGERLAVFDVFLERDDLFSRVETWLRVFREFDESQGSEWRSFFGRAARDPFWKGFDLDECGTMKPVVKRRLAAFVVICCSLVAALVFLWKDCGALEKTLCVTVPALTPHPPVVDSPSAEFDGRSPPVRRIAFAGENAESARKERLPQVATGRECVLPPVRISGIVEGRLFLAVVDGKNTEFLLGESVGNYRVDAIGRSSVTLVCGNESREVRNGK